LRLHIATYRYRNANAPPVKTAAYQEQPNLPSPPITTGLGYFGRCFVAKIFRYRTLQNGGLLRKPGRLVFFCGAYL